MALQLALTTLESLAEMLNERKRECEQTAAFHEKVTGFLVPPHSSILPLLIPIFPHPSLLTLLKLRPVGGKIGKTEGTRMLLREDDVQRLEFNGAGQVLYPVTTYRHHHHILTPCPGLPHQGPPSAPS